MITLLVVAMFVVSACSSGQAFKDKKGLKDSSVEEACKDSDGDDPYTYGVVRFNGESYEDNCQNSIKLTEFVCISESEMERVQIICDFMCVDGACVEDNNTYCNDSDGGLNYDVYGEITGDMATPGPNYDMCTGDINLREVYCNNSLGYFTLHPCLYGCEDGACVEEIPSNDTTPPTLTAYWNEFSNGFQVSVVAYDESGVDFLSANLVGPNNFDISTNSPCYNTTYCNLSLSSNESNGLYFLTALGHDIYNNEAILNESNYFNGTGDYIN